MSASLLLPPITDVWSSRERPPAGYVLVEQSLGGSSVVMGRRRPFKPCAMHVAVARDPNADDVVSDVDVVAVQLENPRLGFLPVARTVGSPCAASGERPRLRRARA